MAAHIQRRLDRIEGGWESLLDSLSRIDDARLNRPPAEAKWSIAQILSHLLQSEELSLRYLQKKSLAGSEMEKVQLSASWRLMLLVLALRSPFRFRAPQVVATVPEHRSLADIRELRTSVRAGWRDFVASYPDDLLDRACYRHAIAGRLSLDQCLITLRAHLTHHARQIATIKATAA